MSDDQPRDVAQTAQREPQDAAPSDSVAPARPRGGEPSRETLRRRALLKALQAPADGSEQPATRIGGIPASTSLRRELIGSLIRLLLILTALGSILLAIRTPGAVLLPATLCPLVAVFTIAPLSRERRGTSARHGKNHRFLSVRTRTGIRTLDLSRLLRIESATTGLWALDAEGVTVFVCSGYARRALQRGAERWGLGQAAPSRAAQRVLARRGVRRSITRRRRRESDLDLD